MSPETRRYKRSKDHYDTATDAWEDVERRTDLTFDQVETRDHTPQEWAWIVTVEE